MSKRRLLLLFLLGPLLVTMACMAGTRPCYSPQEAAEHAGKDICLSAHVYDVVSGVDGIRYLDICPADTAAKSCHFTVMSLAADRKDVGSLDAVRDQDIHLRGVVHGSEAGSFMLLSNARQFHGGAEKFRANPELMSGFSAGSGAMAFRDPAQSGGHHGSKSVFAGSASMRSSSAQ